MRRKDREVKEFDEIIAIIKACDVCRLALNDEDYPYILPLNFGMQVENGKITLYFHGASEGKKYELIRKDNRASFEMDCEHELFMLVEEGNCTMSYKSVIGRGRIEMISEDEKEEALRILMSHYHQEDFSYNKAVMPMTTVFKLVVTEVTGKYRKKK